MLHLTLILYSKYYSSLFNTYFIAYIIVTIYLQEKELIGEVGDLMCRSLCQIENQLEHNKRFKYKLEENWSDKKQSFQIDSINLGLNIQSPIIMSHKDVVNDADK